MTVSVEIKQTNSSVMQELYRNYVRNRAFDRALFQYSTLQYSTVQYSTVHYSTVQYSTVQYSTVQWSAPNS
jgi:esterase/lipase superfamily enzyme